MSLSVILENSCMRLEADEYGTISWVPYFLRVGLDSKIDYLLNDKKFNQICRLAIEFANIVERIEQQCQLHEGLTKNDTVASGPSIKLSYTPGKLHQPLMKSFRSHSCYISLECRS